MYKAKGKYNAYQTEIKGEDGKRKSIGIMESKLVKEFLNHSVPKIIKIYNAIEEQVRTNFLDEQDDFSQTILKCKEENIRIDFNI